MRDWLNFFITILILPSMAAIYWVVSLYVHDQRLQIKQDSDSSYVSKIDFDSAKKSLNTADHNLSMKVDGLNSKVDALALNATTNFMMLQQAIAHLH